MARAELDAPTGEVLHRRLADELDEALVQRGARQANVMGEIVHAPPMIGALVHEREGLADVAIAQSRQPAGGVLGQSVEIAPGGVDEHHLREPLEHGIATRSR